MRASAVPLWILLLMCLPCAASAQQWVHVHSEVGERYRFARNLTGHSFDGEMYISFHEHISSRSQVFVKKWSGRGWEDVPLPRKAREQPSNRHKLRSHEGTLYLSFCTVGLKNKDIWHIYKRVDGRWTAVGEPVVYENFKWGILANDIEFSPSGELYRVWSGDNFARLEKLAGGSFKRVATLDKAAGFFKIQFDTDGAILLGIGEPGGVPGVKVKKIKNGNVTDLSRGFDYKGYVGRYHFVKDGGQLYFAFRGDLPSRGFHVYRLDGDTWKRVGNPPIAFTQRGDSGDSFGFIVFEHEPLLSYRESGMSFVPMVLRHSDPRGWQPVGKPGFVSHNVSTPRVFAFDSQLYLLFSHHDYKRGKTFLETYRLEHQ